MDSVKNVKMKLAQYIAVLCAAAAMPSYAVDFGVFSDVRYTNTSTESAGDGFALGQFDLFASHQIADNTRAFIEYVFEGEGNEFVIDLERISIQRIFSDRFSIAAGRFHTPIGYWNNAYHHGALLQDTVSRPSFLDFEDGAHSILPMHTVGLMASGRFDSGKTSIGYDVTIGNGPSLNTDTAVPRALEVNNVGDPNDAKSVAVRVGVEPEDTGVQAAVFTMINDVPESGVGNTYGVARGDTLVAQQIFGFDIEYEHDNFNALAEFYSIRDGNKTGTEEMRTATAYYAQFSYRFSNDWKATYRYEEFSYNKNDEYFNLLLGRDQGDHHVLALRYDVDESNALKLEINRSTPDVDSDETMVVLQWAFLIP